MLTMLPITHFCLNLWNHLLLFSISDGDTTEWKSTGEEFALSGRFRLTLSACRRQSMRLIFPFWSGFDRTQHAAFFPVIDKTKSSLHSGLMSFLSLARRRLAHFCLTWESNHIIKEFVSFIKKCLVYRLIVLIMFRAVSSSLLHW